MAHWASTRDIVTRALLGDLLIAVAKYAAAILSRNVTMLAEAIHASSDTMNQFFLLGCNLSAKKDASRYPF
ncbi:MAG: cation transporter [Thermoplasmata archaeon]